MTDDSVHRIWDKQMVAFSRGCRLALGEVIHLQPSIASLLTIVHDKKLGNGEFAVDVELEPFRFRVTVGEDLLRPLRHSGNEMRKIIMTHIVTACFARLQRDHDRDDGENGWQSHRELRALADFLHDHGHKHWADEGFQPELVATAIYPLALPNSAIPGTGDGGTL